MNEQELSDAILAHVSQVETNTFAAAPPGEMTGEAFAAQYGGPIVDAIRRLKETLGSLPMDLALKAAHAALTVLAARFGLSAELVAIAWGLIEPLVRSLFESNG